MSATVDVDELQDRFGLPPSVRFEAAEGGMTRIAVDTPCASGWIYLHGAHVSHFQESGQPPMLFMSRASRFDPDAPIRGGVPLCFPWFGERVGAEAPSPSHGFARVATWTVESVTQSGDDAVTVTMKLIPDASSRALWPHRFEARHVVTFGRELTTSLEVRNRDDAAIGYEAALHTYLAVSDVRHVSIRGLEGLEFVDKTAGSERRTQGDEPLAITSETDRVYLGARGPCVVEDPGLGRRIFVEKSGSSATVVWNPWVRKAARMTDFGDDEWPCMLCIETANVAEHAVKLGPGATHTMTAVVRSEPL